MANIYTLKSGEVFQEGLIVYADENANRGLLCSPLNFFPNSWEKAKDLCINYKGGGYDDWRLPTKEELSLIYINLHKKGIGNFANEGYWTSNLNSFDKACYLFFFDGTFSYSKKRNPYYARAVRVF